MNDWASFSLKKISNTKGRYNFFIEKTENDILLMQIYVNDITFDVTNDSMSNGFFSVMQNEFEIYMIEELQYFHGLQIH